MPGKALHSPEQAMRDTAGVLIIVGSFRPHVAASVEKWCLRRLLNVSEEVQMSAGRALRRAGAVTLRDLSPNVQRQV